jgi:hypothetical protein
VDRDDMPDEVREAGGVLLAMAPHADEITTARGLRQAVVRSGVFLEAHMARAAAAPATGGAPTPSPADDMKAALLVFRGALSAWLAHAVPQEAADLAPGLAAEPGVGADTEAPAPSARLPSGGVASPAAAMSTRPAPSVQPTPSASVEAPPDEIPSTGPAPRAEPPEPERVSAKPDLPPSSSGDEPIAPRFAAFTTAPKVAPNATVAARGALSPLLQAGMMAEDAAAETPAGSFAEAKTAVARGYGAPAADTARSKVPLPPYASGPMAGQKPGPPVMSGDQSPADVVRGLLKGAGGALARQDLMQIASLPEPQRHGETDAAEARPQGARLNLDLPFVTPHGVAVAQFEISHDSGGSGGGAVGSAERTYKVRFSIDVEPLGPVHALVTLTGARARVSLWAERSETIARLRAGEEALGAALRQADLSPEVAVHSGAPPSPGGVSPLGHFVDQAS